MTARSMKYGPVYGPVYGNVSYVAVPLCDCKTNCSSGSCDACIVQQPFITKSLNTLYAERAKSLIEAQP